MRLLGSLDKVFYQKESPQGEHEMKPIWLRVRTQNLGMVPFKIIESAMPESAHKLKMVYNPLPELSVIEKRLGCPILLYLGGDSQIKGFDIHLKASHEVLKQNLCVRFMLTCNFRDTKGATIERLNERLNGA